MLIGNVRQATSEEKSGPVETGLTGPAATALNVEIITSILEKCGVFQRFKVYLCIV